MDSKKEQDHAPLHLCALCGGPSIDRVSRPSPVCKTMMEIVELHRGQKFYVVSGEDGLLATWEILAFVHGGISSEDLQRNFITEGHRYPIIAAYTRRRNKGVAEDMNLARWAPLEVRRA